MLGLLLPAAMAQLVLDQNPFPRPVEYAAIAQTICAVARDVQEEVASVLADISWTKEAHPTQRHQVMT